MKFTPHPYQRDIIGHIIDTPRCALFIGMGAGKTSSVLAALDLLWLCGSSFHPALVLAPLRVCNSVWPVEVQKWDCFKHLKVSVVTGTATERRAALKVKADIYVMNYDNVLWLADTLGTEWPFKVVVADESTRLKSFRLRHGSKRAAALAKFARQTGRWICMTGTPAPNGLKDLWGQLWFLDFGERLGRSFTAFFDRWFSQDKYTYMVTPAPNAENEIHAKLSDICLTIKGLDVDEPIFNVIKVPLPKKAMRQYKELEREMFVQLEEVGVEVFNAAALSNKCMQFANGAVYVDKELNWKEVHDAKIDALKSVINEAAGMPVLVAYYFKSDLARLLKAFPNGRELDKNPKTITDWNASKIPILFAHPASAGHGISLQDGSNILCFFSLTWNLEHYQQTIERIGPMRQKQSGYARPVFVHLLVAENTVDELVEYRLQSKASVQEALLRGLRC